MWVMHVGEKILVVPREVLFRGRSFTGFLPAREFDFLSIIKDNAMFVERTHELEKNPQLQQIIPYVIFVHDGNIFMYKRQAREMEKRYEGLYSVGLGGHVKANEQNADVMKTIEESIEREFNEEINYSGSKSLEFVGYIKFEHDVFNSVHFGIVYLVNGDSPDIKGKDETEGGMMVSLSQAREKISQMEEWSKAVIENIL